MARFLISWQARRTLTHKRRHTKTLLTPHILYVACMCSSWERAGWPLRRTKGCFVRWRCSANQRSLPCSMKSSWKLHFAVSSSFQSFFSLLEWRLYVYIWTWNFSGTETEKGHRKYPLSKNGEWSCPKDHSDGIRHPPCSLSLCLSPAFSVDLLFYTWWWLV